MPLQEISKIITSHTADTIDENLKEDTKDVVNNEKNPDLEIDEIWAKSENSNKVSFADEVEDEEDVYSKRSFTPIWKKDDDEKPLWGDDEEEEVKDTE